MGEVIGWLVCLAWVGSGFFCWVEAASEMEKHRKLDFSDYLMSFPAMVAGPLLFFFRDDRP